jgi:protoporphyrinogen oxidase
MCRSFFFPSTRKLWRTPLSRLGYDWTDWSVPVPRIEEVEAGARGEGKGRYGYNTTFLYPAEGGIGSLVSALAAPVASRIRTGDGVVELDLRRRTARTAGGETIRWEAAVSTIPLPALANASLPLSAGCREAADALAWVKVLAVNLGIANPGPFPGHWHYVPERGYPFFRVGSLSNVWPGAAPPGSGSFFAERSFPSSARVDVGKETDAILAGLRKSGLLAPGSRLESVRPVMLDPAYVLFDRRRSPARKRLLSSFERKGVFPAGRYGAWDYNGMAASVADGVRAAGRALGYGG